MENRNNIDEILNFNKKLAKVIMSMEKEKIQQQKDETKKKKSNIKTKIA